MEMLPVGSSGSQVPGVSPIRAGRHATHLPRWSSRATSAARYELVDGVLHLLIEADQAPWCPEFDGWLRVSSLQTGVFAGPVGSGIGQHRFADGMVVREAQENVALYTPRFGLFEVRAKALDDPANMVALWSIGYGERPEQSGEILIMEIFGRDMTADSAAIGMGVRPHQDPGLTNAFEQVPVAIDVREFHTYSAEWTPDHVAHYVDERLVKVVRQSFDCPLQFMLGIYEFAHGPEPPSPAEAYPKILSSWTGSEGTGGRLDNACYVDSSAAGTVAQTWTPSAMATHGEYRNVTTAAAPPGENTRPVDEAVRDQLPRFMAATASTRLRTPSLA